METSPDDPQLATKIAVENPMGAEDCSETMEFMDEFLATLHKKRNYDGKGIFREVLNAMLDVRLRLPPIYNFKAGNFIVDRATNNVKILISKDLFIKERPNYVNLERNDLLYISPEELFGHGRSLTTPFWVLGC